MNILIFLFLNLLVGLSSYLLAKRYFASDGKIDFYLSWFSLFFAQIILGTLILGLLGELYLANIVLLHFTVLTAVFFSCRNNDLRVPRPDPSFILKNRLLLFSISIFVGFFLIELWLNLINPPICPESHQYHLGFPATWLRNGNLDNPIVIFGCLLRSVELTALSYYPMNAEFFFFWLMLPLRNAFLADIGPAPFYLVGILAIYSILRKYSIKKDTALFIGLLWALIPNIFKQIRNGTQIDVVCAAVFLLVLNNLLILKRQQKLRQSALFGISLGIFFGLKVLNIYWFAALLPLSVYFIVRYLRRNSLAMALLNSCIILFFLFLLGSFSYLRTFILTANPVYPVKFVLFGKEIFPGIIDKSSFSKIFVDWNEFRIKNMFFSEGLGLQFIAFIFPATIIPAVTLPFFRKKSKTFWEYFLLFLAPLIMLMLYLFNIKAYWVRYFFPYLGMGFIAAAIFLKRFKWGEKYITIVGFLCVLSSAAELARRNQLVISFILSFLLFSILVFLRKKIISGLGKILSLRNLFIFIVIGSIFLYFLNEKYNKEEFSRYPLLAKAREAQERDVGLAWRWMNENSGSDSRIAYTGRGEYYPLFGSKIKNDVFYISLNDKPSHAHYYPDGFYRREKNFNHWMRNLKESKIDYLFIMLPYAINNESGNPEEFPIEDKWASLNPKQFRLVFSNSYAHIYKLLYK